MGGLNVPPHAKFCRIRFNGAHVYWWDGAYHEVFPDVEVQSAPPVQSLKGVYAGCCGRRAFYRGYKDQRDTPEFAEAVRDRRQRDQTFVRAILPGSQRMT